ENLGQDIEKVGMDIDSICPMVYPSHYANKAQNGQGQTINGVKFTAPDLEPYKVVYNSLVKAKDRIAKVSNYKAKIRPYLQDFTASWLTKGYYKKYTAEDVKEQIKAAHDAGYDEWILWDAQNKYSEDALSKK
ncbi:MAG TPA: putative glycoside hydrolase, partial [Clostridia bacterium]